MEEYEALEKKCNETKMYAKRVMDLYCDAKKWKWLAQSAEYEEDEMKYMQISNTLMEMFNKEVQNMKV